MKKKKLNIGIQGVKGSYHHIVSEYYFEENFYLRECLSFDHLVEEIIKSNIDKGVIAIENSIAGRVADIHHLLPQSGLHIIAEHFQGVNHHLLAQRGATLESISQVQSHIHALAQCRSIIRELGLEARIAADTAGSAAEIATSGDPSRAAIASRLAAEIYGLEVLRENIEDSNHNTTRFLVMSEEPSDPDRAEGPVITTFVFKVRNIPAALYKALGGFATNGVNMLKLESYLLDGSFTSAQFYADVEGHPDETALRLALEELGFFSRTVNILGVYTSDDYRRRSPSSDE